MNGLGLRELYKNVATTFGRQLSAGIIQLVTIAIIARTYGPEGNGVYAIALLLPTTLTALLNLGIAPANVYFLGSGKIATAIAWRSNLRIFVWIAIPGTLLGGMAILAGLFENWFPGVPMHLFMIALFAFPSSFFLTLTSSIFQGLQKFNQLNLIYFAQPFVNLICITFFALIGARDIFWLLISYLFASITTIIIAVYSLMPLLKKTGSNFPGHIRASINYGYKAHLSNILAFVNYKADIFLVNFFIGPAGTGLYVIAVQLVERLWILSQAVSTVLLPRLSQLSNDECKRNTLTPLVSRLVLAITLFGALCLAIVGYPLIIAFFGNDFRDAYIPLLLLLPGIVAGSGARVLANDIAARGRPELNMYTSFIVVTANIIGNIILIPTYGLIGAAIATSAAYTLNFILRLAVHRYFTAVPVLNSIIATRRDFFELRSLLLIRR
jgi:O-antigen/teichoic acid export membrane protein